MKLASLTRTAALGLIIGAAGCSSVTSKIGEGIGNAVGTKIGNSAGAAVSSRMPAMWTPDFTQMYATLLFTVAFHAGSYDVEPKAYQPGDYTRWRMVEASQNGSDATIERAFLTKTADGKEWWRVKYIVSDASEKPAKVDTIAMEALFTGDGGQLVRMRGKFPGDKEAKEMAVTENTYGYTKPTSLTPESIQGATVGTENVSVPAGSFSARHVKYANMGGGSLDWWTSQQVPGGLVRYSATGPDSDNAAKNGPSGRQYTVELTAFGKNAKTEMASY